ncbi:MAG: YidC/Oxa1 family membrane protein insertase [Streptosporangiaceae bacterium]
MSGLLGVPVDAAYHLVTTLSALLTPVAGGLAVAVAIAAFTVAVRLLVLPFSYYALRGQAAQARIAPQVQALRQRYAKQPDRLSRELKALYAENGTSMLGGCLPLLLQWPFLSVLYLLFRSTSIGGAPNELLTHHLFGAQLGSHWLGGAGPLSAHGAVFAALFVLLGLCGWLAARAARRLSASVPSGPGTIVPDNARAGAAGPQPGQAATVPPWLTSLMPYLTAVFAAFLPLAAGLYLLTTTAWTLLERSLLRRFLLPASPPSPAAPIPVPAARRPASAQRRPDSAPRPPASAPPPGPPAPAPRPSAPRPPASAPPPGPPDPAPRPPDPAPRPPASAPRPPASVPCPPASVPCPPASAPRRLTGRGSA